MSEYPTWEQVVDGQESNPLYRILVQCVVTISTAPNHSHLTMDEIYDMMIRHAEEMRGVLT